MKPLKIIENNKRFFVWVYDIYFFLLIAFIGFMFIIGFESPLWDNETLMTIIILPIIILALICGFANIFFGFYYTKKNEKNNWAVWGFISILFGLFPYVLIFLPLHYFIKLRPYWVGKKKSVY
jgi:uncharacterized membrane protein HdeD (DUF308 family)